MFCLFGRKVTPLLILRLFFLWNYCRPGIKKLGRSLYYRFPHLSRYLFVAVNRLGYTVKDFCTRIVVWHSLKFKVSFFGLWVSNKFCVYYTSGCQSMIIWNVYSMWSLHLSNTILFSQAARNNVLLAVPAGLYAINNYLKFTMQVHVLLFWTLSIVWSN